ncbi:carbohydrate-binding protein [Microbispora sp. NPDC088329]|uniref:carbohydrate-binding protein n=1 Tax=Microbispora sp. NPDC088329 TaxID=3154869 RepID=UPI00342A88CB
MAESLGGTLASRYHLLRPLGSGGMGTVWLARDSVLDREVAIKELRLPEGLGERERAETGAKVAAIPVAATGGVYSWATATAPVCGANGVKDVYLVFTGDVRIKGLALS